MLKRILKVILFYIISIISLILFIKLLFIIDYGCFYRKLFNLYCAGCGVTRMFESLFHLEIYQAFRYNPVMFILFILFMIYLIINTVRYIMGKNIIKLPVKVYIVIGFILLLFMVIRNIPGFEFLQPIEV